LERHLRWLDDLDGGGIADFAVGDFFYQEPTLGPNVGRICVFSTETELMLYQVIGTEIDGYFGVFDVVADINADGFRDLLVSLDQYGPSGEGEARILSGLDGSTLRAYYGSVPWGRLGEYYGGLDDVDGDGVGDYAISAAGDVGI
jgi:hypothetical protein